jgi:cell wall-associated NlpC family hydrolase
MIRQILLFTMAASTAAGASAQGGTKSATPAKEVKFIEDIEVGFGPDNASRGPKAGTATVAPSNNPSSTRAAAADNSTTSKYSAPTSSKPLRTVAIEDAGTLHLKFAILLNTEVETVPALPLLMLMDDWWGTKYRLGGHDRGGIDCSGFTCMLYTQLFQAQLPRTAREQFQAARSIDPSLLKEGDLVFFSNGGSISHVGFYLQNNKFVHASTSEGVTISDLNDRYWQAKFAGAGRWEPGVSNSALPSKP